MSESKEQVTVNELAQRLDAGEAIRIVDVREPEEFEGGHLPGAVNIPLGTVASSLPGYSATETVAIVCQGGVRSEKARQRLLGEHHGLLNVVGGTSAWIAAGLPTEKP
jgi:rhodanese-related sulfurtransferase